MAGHAEKRRMPVDDVKQPGERLVSCGRMPRHSLWTDSELAHISGCIHEGVRLRATLPEGVLLAAQRIVRGSELHSSSILKKTSLKGYFGKSRHHY